MKKIISLLLSSLLVSIFFIATPANAVQETTILFQDNFDEEPSLAEGITTLTKWDIVDGNVDVIGEKGGQTIYDFYPGNGLFLDLSGYLSTSTLEAKDSFKLTPGFYKLSFKMGKNGDSENTYTVELGDLFKEQFPPTGLTTFEREIGVAQETDVQLRIINNGPNIGGGPVLLEVTLTKESGC
ncbi:hypothetical protein [Okeania sp. SIO2B3]|uniref:hypothetical protein n=1 Tax=Okeania sp. SIO2B3 TaxID=2607784 RepID=UPI0013C1B0A7|nr:hypothetical protein [Okeania sp. SIO2B3]NET41835.1 hypothetical protein [Okeania sp. SIO2B3]